MNLLSTGFRFFGSENSESETLRKPNVSTTVFRQPFSDKTINCNSPNLGENKKAINEGLLQTAGLVKANLEIADEEVFSRAQMKDSYDDILPLSKRLEGVHLQKIIQKFLAQEDKLVDQDQNEPISDQEKFDDDDHNESEYEYVDFEDEVSESWENLEVHMKGGMHEEEEKPEG